MTTRTIHVVGAGLAGLSAATILAERGERVVVHEAAAQAGGRCRSYFDPQLGMTIDNGNHLVLSGNRAVQAYLTRLGAAYGRILKHMLAEGWKPPRRRVSLTKGEKLWVLARYGLMP